MVTYYTSVKAPLLCLCHHYPRLWAEGIVVCLCVCVCVLVSVLPQNCCLNSIIKKSKQVAALKLGNLRQTVALYKIG